MTLLYSWLPAKRLPLVVPSRTRRDADVPVAPGRVSTNDAYLLLRFQLLGGIQPTLTRYRGHMAERWFGALDGGLDFGTMFSDGLFAHRPLPESEPLRKLTDCEDSA